MDGASELFEAALEAFPAEYEIAFFLGVARRRDNKDDEALAVFATVPPSHKHYSEARTQMARRGLPTDGLSDDDIQNMMRMFGEMFRENAPVTAEQAATIILDGVRAGKWRILVGDDAHALDEAVRGDPEAAYAVARLFARGDLGALTRRSEELQAWAGNEAPVWQGRMVVLVDRGSLGASEVLATVLRQKVKAELVAACFRITNMIYALGSGEDWLTPFEREILLLCAATEMDAR